MQRILGRVAIFLRLLSVLKLSKACRLHEDEDNRKTQVRFTREHIASCGLMVIILDEKAHLLHELVKDYLV